MAYEELVLVVDGATLTKKERGDLLELFGCLVDGNATKENIKKAFNFDDDVIFEIYHLHGFLLALNNKEFGEDFIFMHVFVEVDGVK